MLSRRRFLEGTAALAFPLGYPLVGRARKPRKPPRLRSIRTTDLLHVGAQMVTITRTPPVGGGGEPLVYPPTTSPLLWVPTNSDPRPGYLAEITDSTWGTKIRRITNTDQWKNNYPKHQSWNANSTVIYLGNGKRFLDGNTYADLNKVWPGGVEYPVWSNVDPNRMWGCKDNVNVIKRFDYSTLIWVTHHTFAGKGHMSLGEYEGNINDADTRVALIFNTTVRTGGGSWGVLVYDPVNDAEISSRTLGPGGANEPNNCMISRSGDYVVVQHGANGSGAGQGTWVYDAATMAPIRQIVTTRPHADMGRDINGNDIYVHMEGSGGCRVHRLSNGASVDIFGGLPISQLDSGHVSCTNYERPGWAYLSSNTRTTGDEGSDQFVAVKTDGSGEIQVFAFGHAEGLGTYQFSPHMAASRDGARVIFGSTWGPPGGSNPMYCFVAGMTT